MKKIRNEKTVKERQQGKKKIKPKIKDDHQVRSILSGPSGRECIMLKCQSIKAHADDF